MSPPLALVRWRQREGRMGRRCPSPRRFGGVVVVLLLLLIGLEALAVADASDGGLGGVGVGEKGGGERLSNKKLSGIIIPGYASTQLRAWSVLDCPYSPLDFNPLDLVWLDSTRVISRAHP